MDEDELGANESGKGSSFFLIDLVVIAVILYFIWMASPMAEHISSIGWADIYEKSVSDGDKVGVAEKLMSWGLDRGYIYLWILTILFPICVVMLRKTSVGIGGGAFISLLCLAGLGWYIGGEYEASSMAYAMCENKSGIFSSCTRSDPMLSYMLFNLLLVLICFRCIYAIIMSIITSSKSS